MSDKQMTKTDALVGALLMAFLAGMLVVGSLTAIAQAFTGRTPSTILLIAFAFGGGAGVAWRLSLTVAPTWPTL